MSEDSRASYRVLPLVLQLTPILIAAGALIQTAYSLKMTGEGLQLVREQLTAESARHAQSRVWSIAPAVRFDRTVGSVGLSTVNFGKVMTSSTVATVVNVGEGAAISTTIEWKWPSVAQRQDVAETTHASPDNIASLERSQVPALPEALLGDVVAAGSVRGSVKIRCRGVDGEVVTVSQVFECRILRAGDSSETIEVTFSDVEQVDWTKQEMMG